MVSTLRPSSSSRTTPLASGKPSARLEQGARAALLGTQDDERAQQTSKERRVEGQDRFAKHLDARDAQGGLDASRAERSISRSLSDWWA
jgi:hypothetical protein